jgi:hypothetical protein
MSSGRALLLWYACLCSIETLVDDFCWTQWHYIPDHRTLHNHCENLRSNIKSLMGPQWCLCWLNGYRLGTKSLRPWWYSDFAAAYCIYHGVDQLVGQEDDCLSAHGNLF